MSVSSDAVIDYSTPKARKNYKYDLPEPSNYRSWNERDKYEFCKKRMAVLKDFRDSLLYEVADIEHNLKEIQESMTQLEKSKKSKDSKKEKEKEKKDKKKMAGKKMQIFGKPLSDNYENDVEFIRSCIKFISKEETLKTEGIFRISVQTLKLDNLEKIIEDSGSFDFEKIELCQDPFIVPCLMKKFFRELPDPLFTYDCYTCFLSASGVEDADLRMKKYRDVISIIIKELCDFLFEVQKYSQFNKMSYGNLGTCFGPSLLRDQQDYDPMSESVIVSDIVADIIEHKDYLFSNE